MGATIKITKGGLFSAAYFFLIVFITIQIAIGSFLIIYCESVKFSLLKYFHEIQKNELNIRMYLIEFYSLHLIIFYFCGYLLAKKCLSEPYTEHLQLLLKFWNTIICLLSFEGLITAWLCQESFDSLAQSIEISLYRGIDSYYENSNWRLIWDNLQFHNQCCGVKDYHDWEAITWMEYEMKTKSDKALTNLEYVSLAPYSCCKIASSCYENLFTDNHYDERAKQIQLHQLLNTNVSVINRMGCLDDLVVRISSILDITIELAIVVFIVQFLISVLMAFVFVTNRTFRSEDNSDDEFGGSDLDNSCRIGRYITKTEDLREKYCACMTMEPSSFNNEGDHRDSGVHHRLYQSHHPHQHHLHVGHHGSIGHLERHGSHYDIHYDTHRRSSLAHDGDHRRSSSYDPSQRYSSVLPKETDDDVRRSILSHEPRRSSIPQSEETRRSTVHYSESHRAEDPRRSSFYNDEESAGRFSRRHHNVDNGQPDPDSIEEFRQSILEPTEELRSSVVSYEQRHSNASADNTTNRRSTVTRSSDGHRRSRSTES